LLVPDLLMKARFVFFLMFFSIVMAGLIYWKEVTLRHEIKFVNVVFWQLIIWMPWVLFFHIIKLSLKKINTDNQLLKYLILGAFYLVILLIHWLWFASYSSYFSPFLGAPNENYGAFRYFFIFWILIDLVFLMTIWVYLKFYNNKSTILSPMESTILVKRGNKKVFLNKDNIYWISADGYYINIHSNQGKFLLRRTLKDIFESLPRSNFIKIHRSAIININYLQELHQAPNKRLTVQMKDGNSHAVSKTFAKNIKDILKSTSF
jgi:hypothetical protein